MTVLNLDRLSCSETNTINILITRPSPQRNKQTFFPAMALSTCVVLRVRRHILATRDEPITNTSAIGQPF